MLAPDLYLAALLAPRASRSDLLTLAAFIGDVTRIALTVSDSTLALIRLQWWRDAMAGGAAGERSGHPVADAMGELLARVPDVRVPADELIEAHDHLIASGELCDAAELAAYIACTVGGAFRAAQFITDSSRFDASQGLIAIAGQSYGLIRLAVDLPYFLVRGRRPLPLSYFGGSDPRDLEAGPAEEAVAAATRLLCDEAARALVALRAQIGGDSRMTVAILPAALVGPYSRALQRPGRRTLTEPADIAPATRAARLWLASWSRRV